METWETQLEYTPKPKTRVVAGVLVLVALLISWLGCFALVGVLQDTEVMQRFPPGHDPRLRWFLYAFVGLMSLIAIFVSIAWFFSLRHEKSLRALEEEAE